MSLSKAVLQFVVPARNSDPDRAEPRSDTMTPSAERGGPAAQARRPAELATHEPARGAEAAALETVEDRGRNLMADRSARPCPSREPRLAPGKPTARIYQRGRSPMQSGRARESIWLLTFEPRYRPEIDFLMGWTGSRDTLQQVELRFSTLEEAVAFAKRRGLTYEIETPRRREVRPKSYADNFRHDRILPWTH